MRKFSFAILAASLLSINAHALTVDGNPVQLQAQTTVTAKASLSASWAGEQLTAGNYPANHKLGSISVSGLTASNAGWGIYSAEQIVGNGMVRFVFANDSQPNKKVDVRVAKSGNVAYGGVDGTDMAIITGGVNAVDLVLYNGAELTPGNYTNTLSLVALNN